MDRCRKVLLMALDIAQAARGAPPVASCRGFISPATASEAHTSKGLGCTGTRTKSATRIAAAHALVLGRECAGQVNGHGGLGRMSPHGLRVLRAAGEPVISEYSISHRTLRPSAYTPKRWVGQESRED